MPDSYFITLYLDENIPVLLANLLKAKGFNAISARDAGMLNKSDLQHLEYAANNRLTLLTHNRCDFETLHSAYVSKGLNHYGIIIARQRGNVYELLSRLLKILNSVTADEIVNLIRYI
jgi:predicted nuclease of predicted toxin-antitoxin system